MNSSVSWWSNFFNGLSAEVVTRLYSSEQTLREANFIQTALRLGPNDTVADVPCGDGRLSILLAKRGFRVRGLDLSEDLIGSAERSACAQDVSVEFKPGDMKALKWKEDLDGAFCFGNSFAYFDEEGNEEFLRSIYHALRAGGRFLLQTNVIAESVLTKPLSRSWYELGDILFLHAARYEPETSSLISDYQFIRGQEIEKKSAVYHVYLVRELLDLLREAGFRSLRAMANFNEDPFRLGDPSLYVLAEK